MSIPPVEPYSNVREAQRALGSAANTDCRNFQPGRVFLDQLNLSNKMKTSVLPISAVVAAILVAALLPISVPAAGIAATMSGLLAIAAADYGRNLEPLRPDFRVSEFHVAECRDVELGEAA